MADKRLNFNRPILSVRRTVANNNSHKDYRRKNETSIPALLPSPSYRSDLHSGPLRNPGTVPFVWEHSPGRPKDDDEGKTQKPPIAPNPPPGRVLKQDLKKERLRIRNDNDRENEKPQVMYGPNFLQLNDDDDDDTEGDGDFEYDEHGHMSSLKFCGLLPHFCLKGGSIGMLNQTPGLRSVRTRLPISSANTPRVGSQNARVTAYEPKSSVKNQKDPTILNHESTENTNQKSSQKLEQDHEIPYNHNESSQEKEVNLQKKGLISFKELLAQELLAYEIEKETNLANHTVEKTLYVDTVQKVESLKSEFKEPDGDIFGTSHIPTESYRFDFVADNSRYDQEMITQTGFFNDPKVDQKVKVYQKHESEMPTPPPLPKSPSDSWLWRTLPYMNSKTNHKLPSKTAINQGKKGLLRPISET